VSVNLSCLTLSNFPEEELFQRYRSDIREMKIQIENNRIVIGENGLEYYPYYFAIWKEDIDHRITVKNVLLQWASALATLKDSRLDAVYLPYYLDDETCRFLKAELDGEDVMFTDMLVEADGYGMDLDDFSLEMYSEPDVIYKLVGWNGQEFDETPKFFGRYNAEEVIAALKSAEIAEA
jgi:hypothetical protein